MAEARHIEPPMVVLQRKVCSTREQAREVVASRPDASPGMAVYLRCDLAPAAPAEIMGTMVGAGKGVEILTPSFAHEILKAWPKAHLAGASDEVQESWNVAAAYLAPTTREEREA